MSKAVDSKYTPEERKQKHVEVSLYTPNKLAYTLILWSIVAALVYTVTILGNVETNFYMGLITMFNIAMLFTLFTTAVKVNTYSLGWTKAAFFIGVYLIIRMLVVVPFVLEPTGSETIIYGAIAVNAVMLFVASFISYKRITVRTKLMESMEVAN